MPPPNRRHQLADSGSAIGNVLITYFGSWLPAAIVLLVILVVIIVLI